MHQPQCILSDVTLASQGPVRSFQRLGAAAAQHVNNIDIELILRLAIYVIIYLNPFPGYVPPFGRF